MHRYLLRVWLPDRPGALGQVASRIGAVRADVEGIDILERGAGRAVDELVIALPDPNLLDLLISEVSQVDGVDVEDVRPLQQAEHDPRLAALESAERLVLATNGEALLEVLCCHVGVDLDADWSAVVDVANARTLVTSGNTPEAAWLAAFLVGSKASEAVASGEAGPDDVAWAPLPDTSYELVVGRRGRPFRARERRLLALVGRIAAARWHELT